MEPAGRDPGTAFGAPAVVTSDALFTEEVQSFPDNFFARLQEVIRIGASATAARLREAGTRFEAQLRDLERQFDAKARQLSEEYVSAVDELNGEE